MVHTRLGYSTIRKVGVMHSTRREAKSSAVLALQAFVLGIIWFQAGCMPQQRPREAKDIESTYTAFRSALIAKDFVKAKELVGSDFASIYSPERVQRTFDLLMQTNYVLTKHAYVMFLGENEACLWPQSQPEIGVTGVGFVRETNRWRISGSFIPVVH
jgi:hypothetical protein